MSKSSPPGYREAKHMFSCSRCISFKDKKVGPSEWSPTEERCKRHDCNVSGVMGRCRDFEKRG